MRLFMINILLRYMIRIIFIVHVNNIFQKYFSESNSGRKTILKGRRSGRYGIRRISRQNPIPHGARTLL